MTMALCWTWVAIMMGRLGSDKWVAVGRLPHASAQLHWQIAAHSQGGREAVYVAL